MSRWTPEQKKRIDEIESEVARLGKEFREIVQPTENEIAGLLEDVEVNPHVYISFLEDDDFFIAENVYMEVTAIEEN